MIGFYNRSVVLTYIGLAVSIYGMYLASIKNFNMAMICLIISGFCDMFDGKIARITKRSKDAEVFGIQIDSLCDVICFGVFPALMGIFLGIDNYGIIILALFVIAGVIRLGYFNVMEQKRQEETTELRKYYEGLPITSTSILLPLYYSILGMTKIVDKYYLYLGFYALIGFLFVSKIKVKKPHGLSIVIFITLAILIILRLVGIF